MNKELIPHIYVVYIGETWSDRPVASTNYPSDSQSLIPIQYIRVTPWELLSVNTHDHKHYAIWKCFISEVDMNARVGKTEITKIELTDEDPYDSCIWN